MKSPFTGKEMKKIHEKRIWKFRGEEYEYYHTAWRCEDTHEEFTTDESDTIGFIQVTNQYRSKNGIPYTDEIIAIREKYGISAAKMAQILGMGSNQYRLYEQGEVPNLSNGKLIRSIRNPKVMLDTVEGSKHILSDTEYAKLIRRIHEIINDSTSYSIEQYENKRIYENERGLENGYAPLSLSRLKNVLLYILNHCKQVWCTKMNKLLFYIDYLAYRETGMAITGLSYKAIDYGPVPLRWDKVYSEFNDIQQNPYTIGNVEGIIIDSQETADESLFSKQELRIMKTVCFQLGNLSSNELSKLSHSEKAWIDNHTGHHKISFNYAFELINPTTLND